MRTILIIDDHTYTNSRPTCTHAHSHRYFSGTYHYGKCTSKRVRFIARSIDITYAKLPHSAAKTPNVNYTHRQWGIYRVGHISLYLYICALIYRRVCTHNVAIKYFVPGQEPIVKHDFPPGFEAKSLTCQSNDNKYDTTSSIAGNRSSP